MYQGKKVEIEKELEKGELEMDLLTYDDWEETADFTDGKVKLTEEIQKQLGDTVDLSGVVSHE